MSGQVTRILLLVIATLVASLLVYGIAYSSEWYSFRKLPTHRKRQKFLKNWISFARLKKLKNRWWVWFLGLFILFLLPNIWLVNWQFNNAVRSRATSNEYWHTSPENHYVNIVSCSKTKAGGNPCQAVYRCDPYECHCDDDGCDTCYHHCPYTTVELQYVEEYATGDTWIIEGNQLPENPQEYRWRRDKVIPESVISSVGVATPTLWFQYKEQAERGVFRPVTLEKQYLNWFVAISEREAYLGSVDNEWVQYFANKIPDLKRSPNSDGLIDFIYTVGYEMSPEEKEEWVYWLNNMLPAAGMELQATVRIILVEDADALEHADEFARAVQIDWSSRKHGKSLLPKNSVVFVLFIEPGGSQIAKARVFTGMPIGNDGLQNVENLEQILAGQSLDAEQLMGGVTTKRGDGKIYYRINNDNPGAIVRLLWGLDNPDTKFVRVSMEDNFGHLQKLAKPDVVQSIGIVSWTCFINIIAGFFLFALRPTTSRKLANSQEAIKYFLDESIILHLPDASLTEYLAYRFKVTELKSMLKQRGLPVSGRESELTSRLVQADPKGMKEIIVEDLAQQLKVTQLKSMLKQRGLSVSGHKSELESRLIQALISRCKEVSE